MQQVFSAIHIQFDLPVGPVPAGYVYVWFNIVDSIVGCTTRASIVRMYASNTHTVSVHNIYIYYTSSSPIPAGYVCMRLLHSPNNGPVFTSSSPRPSRWLRTNVFNTQPGQRRQPVYTMLHIHDPVLPFPLATYIYMHVSIEHTARPAVYTSSSPRPR